MSYKTKRFLFSSVTEVLYVSVLYLLFSLTGFTGFIAFLIGTVIAVALTVYYIEPKIEQHESDTDGGDYSE